MNQLVLHSLMCDNCASAKARTGDLPFVIQRIGRYASFEEILDSEDAAATAPGVTQSLLLEKLRAIYPSKKEAVGVITLEFEPE